jgi:phage pi2 protein 07
MKYSLIFIFFIVSFFSNSQNIDYSNFDINLLNKKVLIKINKLRRDKGLDTLVYSQKTYEIFSKPNCIEVSNSGTLYHPNNKGRYYTKSVRDEIVGESIKMYGGKSEILTNGLPRMSMYENAFRSNITCVTYDELVERAIIGWENSPSHKEVQNMSYSSLGVSGFFSCDSRITNDGMVYIFVNYVKIFRV